MSVSKRSDAQEKLLPILNQFCTQKPVKIDPEKLARLDNFELSLLDIAWLQSISEMNYVSLNQIEWESQVLLNQVTVIETYLFHISKKGIGEDPNDYSFKEAQAYLLNTIVSLSSAIELFDSIKLENRFDDEKIEDNSLLRGIKKLERARLSEINLKTELLRNQMEYCKNNPVTLVPEQLPEKIWLKELAYYLAVSQKRYKDYVDIDYDDLKIVDCAFSIHSILRKKIREILGVVDEFSLLKPAHREFSKRAGILDTAAFAIKKNGDISDKWSLLVTKELAIKLLRSLPGFHYLIEPNSVNTESALLNQGVTSKPQYRQDAIANLLMEYIFPQISVNLTTEFTQELALQCWSLLSGHVGLTVKIHDKKGQKDKRQFKAITTQNENIFCDFKGFRTRLPNLLKCYKQNLAAT
ncbi:TPA: hypothetical protein SHQ29_001364 [Legionella pneumophila]|nr:hypothetical protein [Legionella pneumophila]HEH5959002.1 hypothetical protein [Legionella pneumophila]